MKIKGKKKKYEQQHVHDPDFVNYIKIGDKKFPVKCLECGAKGYIPAFEIYKQIGKPPVKPNKIRQKPFFIKNEKSGCSHEHGRHKYVVVDYIPQTTGEPYGQYDDYVCKCIFCGKKDKSMSSLDCSDALVSRYAKNLMHVRGYPSFVKAWEKKADELFDICYMSPLVFWELKNKK